MDIKENFITQVLISGFTKAAYSFSQVINRDIKITSSKSSLVRNNQGANIPEEKGKLYVLITRIIGDVSGKSFLICSEDEYREILDTLSSSVKSEENNEAFLVEIDNIVSAPVIAELAKVLDLEIYGDVPKFCKVEAKELNAFILGEIIKDDPCSIITSTTFQFDNKKIHPQFIWKLSSKVLELIPEKFITK